MGDGRSPYGLTVLVGGVGQLFQSDHDVGRIVVDRVTDLAGPAVLVEDLSYGAIPVVHRLQEVRPDVLVLVGSRQRGAAPGTVLRRRIRTLDRTVDELQGAVQDAGTGYVDLGLTLDVIYGLDVLPRRTVAIEVEPAETGPGEQLSPEVTAALPELERLVRAEVRCAPLFDLVALLRDRATALRDQQVDPPLDLLGALTDLLDALDGFDRDGHWGRTFREKDRLRLAIADGMLAEGMDHADWGTIWALIEELERLERASVDDLP